MPRPTVIEKVVIEIPDAGSVVVACHVRWLDLDERQVAVIRKAIADLKTLGAGVSADRSTASDQTTAAPVSQAPMPGVAVDG